MANLGSAIGGLPATVLFNFQLFAIGPRNAAKFREAMAREWLNLEVGHSKDIAVIGRRVGSSVFFAYVQEVGEESLNVGDEILLGVYRIERPSKVFSIPLQRLEFAVFNLSSVVTSYPCFYHWTTKARLQANPNRQIRPLHLAMLFGRLNPKVS